jgi:hypothetical protein
MVRLAFTLALLAGMAPTALGRDADSQQTPRITLSLPPNIPYETAQIGYFMTGTFGGYGDFVKTAKGQSSYDLRTSVDGKAAADIKVIAYLPGCEIVTIEIPMDGTSLVRPLPCKPLGTISLRAQISPAFMTQQGPTEVEVSYVATWDHRFYGYADGSPTTLRLANVVPDERGQFTVAVPDFAKQADLGEGELEFTLRQPHTGNIVAFLKATDQGRYVPWLKVLRSYPPIVQLVTEQL